MSALRKLVLASSGGQEAGLYVPASCDSLVLQQSLLSFQISEEKLHSGALISPVDFYYFIFFWWSHSGSVNISCPPFVHTHLQASWFSPGMNQKGALKRMSLCVCFLHHKGSARFGPCWGLSPVWCGQELLLPLRLSLAGICEVCPHWWCS